MRIGIVGSGPGGMYVAKYLLKAKGLNVRRIAVFDALPTPYGLVRYGVAPDHPEVKSVQNDFDQVMEDERVGFFGNVNVGKDVGLGELRKCFDAVVLAYGASDDRLLGLQGENSFSNVLSARRFVNWYNGHPLYSSFSPDLSGEKAVVVGQGNVGIDCARILMKSIDELAKTDICKHALDVLATSKIRKVSIVGRRGHAQASFTMKELREITKLDGVGCVVHQKELDAGMNPATEKEIAETRRIKRMDEFLRQIARDAKKEATKPKQICLRFLLSPRTLIGKDERLEKVTFQRTKLHGDPFQQGAINTGEEEDLDCSLLLRSIGYKSVPIEETVPFDESKHVIANSKGRVESIQDGFARLYTSGWVKRGPTGIIGTNITDARETVAAITADFEDGKNVRGRREDGLEDLLRERQCKFVDWEGYRRIEAEENKRGASSVPAKPREKMIKVDEMLEYAFRK